MANGARALRKIQMGLESTAAIGTKVAATAVWRGVGTIQDDLITVFPPEDVGNLGGASYSYIPKTGGLLTLEQDCLFEQLPYVFSAGVTDLTAGSADAGGTGKIYTYAHGGAAAQEVETYTIEGGDNIQMEFITGAFVTDFSISGAGGEALKLSSNWVGTAPSDTASYTASLALITTLETIAFSNGALYIDAADSGTAVGTTVVSNTLLGMTLKDTTGMIPVWGAGGSKNYMFRKVVAPEIVLDVTFEHNASAHAQKALWRLGTARQLQLKFVGSALATPGDYTLKTFIINMAGAWEKFSKLDEQNGNDILTGTFRVRNNDKAGASGLFCTYIVVNEVATLP